MIHTVLSCTTWASLRGGLFFHSIFFYIKWLKHIAVVGIMELKSFYFAESQNLRETKTRRCKIRTVKRDNETWRRTTKIQLMKSLKFRGRSFVLLSIVLLLSFLAVRECKWHTWQVWLIIKPRSAVTCGSAHRKNTKKKQVIAWNKAEWKWLMTLNTLRLCHTWLSPLVPAVACYSSLSSQHGKQLQQTFITWFSYLLSVYVSTLEDSSASKSWRTGHACFYIQIIARGWRSGP